MENVAITFEHLGKIYQGHFTRVAGAGESTVYHLMDNKNFYLGRLRLSTFLKEWCFDESRPKDKLSQLGNFFGDYLTAWFE